jgi:hypothetical protein
MNFLQLVNQLQFESGAGNAPLTSVIGQTGETKRLVDWVRQANIRIQTMYVDWKFLRSQLEPTFITGIGMQDYAAPDDLNYWNMKSFVLDDIDIRATEYHPIDDRFQSNTIGRPDKVSVLDDNQLRFWPVPDGGYLVEAEYFIKPVDLDPMVVDANSQISLIPEQFHWVIVYDALRYYANYENAPEIMNQAREGIALWMPRLEAHQLRGSQVGTIADGNEIVIRAW